MVLIVLFNWRGVGLLAGLAVKEGVLGLATEGNGQYVAGILAGPAKVHGCHAGTVHDTGIQSEVGGRGTG